MMSGKRLMMSWKLSKNFVYKNIIHTFVALNRLIHNLKSYYVVLTKKLA